MRRGFLLIAAVAMLAAGPALAGPKNKKKAAPAAAAPRSGPVATANQKAVSEIMGPWKWGMSVDEVLAVLNKQLSDRAAPELAKMTDVYQQTQVRKKIKADVDQVRSSLIQFQGQRSGWDVSIIEGEFLHKNGESMMHYRETDPATSRDQERFFFFKDGKLWKQFVAFNMDAYKGKTFDDFRAAMEARYGKGSPITKTDREGKTKVVAVAWRAGGTYLRAIDLMQFYGNFCLAFSDENVERTMEAERQARAPKIITPRAEVTDKGEDKVIDPNADVIDRITAPESPAAPAAPATPAAPRTEPKKP